MTVPIADDLAPPFGNYSHALLVPSGGDLLFISGQVGADASGTLPEDALGQVENVFRNIATLLARHDMSWRHVVNMNYFVCNEDDLYAIRQVRDRILTAPYPTASLVVVKALGRPEWLVEIDCIASSAKG